MLILEFEKGCVPVISYLGIWYTNLTRIKLTTDFLFSLLGKLSIP